MYTVHEVSDMSSVSVRTLQYYDRIGLLKPAERSTAGYRLYDGGSLKRLQQILIYRELGFPLKDIRVMLESPDFDPNEALVQQIELLKLKKTHLENLITLAQGIQLLGVDYVTNTDFTAFDLSDIDATMARVKARWSDTEEYKAYEEKSKEITPDVRARQENELMALFAGFGQLRKEGLAPDNERVQRQVKALQGYINQNFYPCSDEMLGRLGRMYAGGGAFTKSIDEVGGEGTGVFVDQAIRAMIS